MTSQHSTHDIKAIISHLTPIISDSTSTVSLSSHPDYRSYNIHCMYEYTTTICMTSYELPMTSHPLFMIAHHTMTSHPLYSSHHSRDACHRIPCSWTIIVYWLYHTYYMCDMKPTVCMTSQEFYMTSDSVFMTWQYCIHGVTSTQFMTAHPRSMISHILYLHHHSHCIYDKTRAMFMASYSVYMTSQIAYQW